MGEFDLIRQYFAQATAGVTPKAGDIHLGIGDDCALLSVPAGQKLAVSTDMLIAGKHFFDDVDPAALGHKALAVNLSDLAAMGATPMAFTLAIATPSIDQNFIAGITRGLANLATRANCPLVGGDTTCGPLSLSITVMGLIPDGQAHLRSGAQLFDDVWVSGHLGAAAFAVSQRYAGQALAAEHPARIALDWPQPRLELGLLLRSVASAAIDLSDGLIGDLGHIATASQVGISIDLDTLPIANCLYPLPIETRLGLALGGGDDYELAFCANSSQRALIQQLSTRLKLPLTRIGSVIPHERGIHLQSATIDSQVIKRLTRLRSFDHFADRPSHDSF